jgi:hypothetical protein
VICVKIAINVLKLRRVTSQEPKTPHHVDQHFQDTEVIAVPEPAPVFVDSTGRRSRVLRGVALAFGVLLVAYGGLVSVSLAGGPVSSSAVLPFPVFDEDEDDQERARKPARTPQPSPSATTTRPIVESTHRNATGPRPSASASPRTTVRTTKSPSPSTSPSRSPAGPITKPVESGTVSQKPEPGPGSGAPVDPVNPVPPPVVENPGSGGTGGGGPAPEETSAPVTPAGPVPAAPADTPTPSMPAAVDDPADTAAPNTRAAP